MIEGWWPERQTEERLRVLEIFYEEIIELTIHHDVLGDNAVVYPNKLDKALSKVDPKWYSK